MADTIVLTGGALTGLAPHLNPMLVTAMARGPLPPETVHLGRRPVRPGHQRRAVHLADHLDLMKYTPPASRDWYTKASASIALMLRNDVKGCCVISSVGHKMGAWTANDSDSGGIVMMKDAEVNKAYAIWNPGNQDDGCNIEDVLAYWQSKGLTIGGKLRKITGYVHIDWTSKDLVRAAIDLFGAVKLGINLPDAWTSEAVWDVTNTQIVGGHDVPGLGFGPSTIVSYSGEGVYIASWGRLYLITWAAFISSRWIEECWVPLAPEWTNSDRLAPNGVNVDSLKMAMAAIAAGDLPNVDPPTPVPPTPTPVPPAPLSAPVYDVTLMGMMPSGSLGRMVTVTLKGEATPRAERHAIEAVGEAEEAGGGAVVAIIAQLLRLVGPAVFKVLPVVLADVQAGKPFAQILADVLAALAK